MTEETRVVLIKPGDVLLIGNVGDWHDEDIDAAGHALEKLGFTRVVVFQSDITMGACSELNGGSSAGHLEGRPVELAHSAASEGLEDTDSPRHQRA